MNDTALRSKAAPFIAGPEVQILEEMLRSCETGDIVTYHRMSEAVGYNVQKKRGQLGTALRRLEKYERMSFASVRGVGMKRLSDSEIVSTSRSGFDTIHRKANRQIKKLRCSEYSKLSDEEKADHNMQASCYGALSVVTRPKNLKKLEAAVVSSGQVLPVQKTLEAFGAGE